MQGRHRLGLFGAAAMLWFGPAAAETFGACRIDTVTLEFAGSRAEQAACLLKRVEPRGVLVPRALPASLLARIEAGAPTLEQAERAVDSLPLNVRGLMRMRLLSPVSVTEAGIPARYFVIHDTSTPFLGTAPFPDDLDVDANVNDLARYFVKEPVAHIFVNRSGELAIGHDFAVPWRATKLESRVIGVPARGRALHIELVQPRRREPPGVPGSDWISPVPGFSKAQYERLAALYVIASYRAGVWMVPGFHAAFDEGLADAHDDPQGFVLENFVAELDRLTAAPSRGRSRSKRRAVPKSIPEPPDLSMEP